LIPTARHALIIKKATVRWVGDVHFGVELSAADCGTVSELDHPNADVQQGPLSMMTH
jgi:hypothetical protein